jgi:hypothetical protein
MKHLRKLLNISVVFFISFCATAQENQWDINLEKSQLNFISVKKNSIAEIHKFKQFYGVLNIDGGFLIDIALDSVDTMIDIRNQRMSDFLFETKRFPVAVLTGKVDMGQISNLRVGDTMTSEVPVQLRLHGNKSDLDLSLTITKLANSQLHVTSRMPVIIRAADFKLTPGIEKLKQLAGLPSIDVAIPVTFDTTWTKKQK